MRHWMWTVAALGVLLLGTHGAQAAGSITPQLADKMAQAGPDELISIYVVMERQADLAQLEAATKGLDRGQKRQRVIDILQDLAREDQGEILRLLEKAQAQGEVQRIRALWLGNTVGCKATRNVIERLAALEGIDFIDWDPKVKALHETGRKREAGSLRPASKERAAADDTSSLRAGPNEHDVPSGSKAIFWSITKINADDVWALGYTGDGIVVGHLDTGVNYNHLDLRDHMWDGSGVGMPNHGYDFATGDGDTDPMDDHGHGTHTAGTIASDGTAGSQVGVAPDAQIMVFKVWDDEGYGTEQDAWSAIQYSILWGADLVSMSGGWPHETSSLCSWRVKCDQIMAAGMVFSTSAGNGDNVGGHYTVPNDISTPADAPAPWYPEPDPGDEHHSSVIAVGATSSTDIIASFSSYGPTEWSVTSCGENDYDDYNYPPGLIKPDVCAPGVNIKSCAYDDTAGYAGPLFWSGTSMSCPHVTGTLALMLSKNPDLTPVQMDCILETTAVDLGTGGRDNYYGAGRIDALAAVNATPEYAEAPEAIVDLRATLTSGSKSSSGDIRLSWSEPSSDLGVDHYVVYRTIDPGASMDSLDSAADTAYTDAGAAGDTLVNYYYMVRAVDTGGQKSSDSNRAGEFDRYLSVAP